MALFPPASVAESDASLFSPAEMGRLMRGEMYRAKRYKYPMVLLLIGVDRLGNLHDLYGFESKREILRAVAELLGSVTRSSDFMGTMVDDRILAIFPHTGRRAAGAISRRLLQGARQMQFDSDGRLVQVTLSVGAVEASLEGVDSFEDLWQAADEALARVIDAGGDRYELREDPLGGGPLGTGKASRPQRAAAARPRPAAQPATPAQPALPAEQPAALANTDLTQAWSPPAGSEEEAFARRLQAMLSDKGMPDEGEFAQLKDEFVAFALNSMGQLRDRSESAAEYERRIELLQRRLKKVSQSLESTEQELRRVVAIKNIDGGLESIYRSVQGLESTAKEGELKKELMKSIFEANLELKKHIEGGGAQ